MSDKLQPTNDAGEILRRIDRFLYDTSDWSIEELKDSLREDGIDPDEMLRKIKARIEPLYKFKESDEQNKE